MSREEINGTVVRWPALVPWRWQAYLDDQVIAEGEEFTHPKAFEECFRAVTAARWWRDYGRVDIRHPNTREWAG